MPRFLSVPLALLALALGACSTPLYYDDPPPRFNTYGRGDNPPPPAYAPPIDQPPGAGSRSPASPPIASDVVPEPPQPAVPRVTPPPAPPQQLPSGTPVAGKPGFVTSPYAPRAGYVDTRGFSPGEQVKCPYSGKIFLVP
ncbi:MAG: hypothetical protein JSR82_01545 [Verrucomicrobia bacterium]|nr:hypothetical protein [Verrucomicrobiota bacterium]